MPGFLDTISNSTWGWDDGEDGWGGPTNRTLRTIAYRGIHKTILSIATTPPAMPAIGDTYIMGSNPTGNWSSFSENDLVVYGRDLATPTTIAWQQFTPRVGWLVYDQNQSRVLVYNGASWGELSNTAGVPVLTDGTSITGDGVTTPLVANFTQVQSDFASTSTSSLAYIKNIPSALRNYVAPPTPPTYWQRINFSGSGRAEGSPIRALIRIGNVRLSDDVDIPYTMSEGDSVRIGAYLIMGVTNLQSASRIYIALFNLGGNQIVRSSRQGVSSGRATFTGFLSSGNSRSFNVDLQVFANAADNFNYSGTIYAGLRFK